MRFLGLILAFFGLLSTAHAETRNYTKSASVQMNGDQLAAQLDTALGFTGTRVTVGITPTLVIVSHPSLTSANDAAVNSAIAAYVFDALYDSRTPAKNSIAAASASNAPALNLVLRATASVLVDEINALRQWNTGMAACVAGAATLAALKTCVATLPALPDRTLSQAATAIQNKITAGSAD